MFQVKSGMSERNSLDAPRVGIVGIRILLIDLPPSKAVPVVTFTVTGPLHNTFAVQRPHLHRRVACALASPDSGGALVNRGQS